MAISRAVLVAYDAVKDCSVRIPKSWRDKIINYEKEVESKQG